MVSSDAMKMAEVLEPLGFKLATEKYLPIKEPIIQEPIIQEPIIEEKFSWGGTLILRLKYVKVGLERKSFIGGLQRVSKTSRREYTKVKNMPKLLGGVGRYVLSTTQGIMTDKKALKLGVGGEVLFSVYSRY
jgi:small subunit ribosomal protein S8